MIRSSKCGKKFACDRIYGSVSIVSYISNVAETIHMEAFPGTIARDRWIYVKGSPDRGLFFSDAVMMSIHERDGDPIIGKGFYKVYPEADSYANTKTGEGHYAPALGFSASVAEVEVDTETGEVKVLKVTTAHDCVFCLNPEGLEAQIEGQIYMGHGIALSEKVLIEEGKVLNPSFLDYKAVRTPNVPEMKTIIVESMEPRSAYGCKEAGEATIPGVPVAIANAIYDAIGVRFREYPITPEMILEGLQAKSAGSLLKIAADPQP